MIPSQALVQPWCIQEQQNLKKSIKAIEREKKRVQKGGAVSIGRPPCNLKGMCPVAYCGLGRYSLDLVHEINQRSKESAIKRIEREKEKAREREEIMRDRRRKEKEAIKRQKKKGILSQA